MQGKFWSFILVLGIIVFSTILYFLLSADDERISAQGNSISGSGGEVIVYVDNKGFNPESITIKPGTLVKWINRDAQNHYVTFTLKSSLDNLNVINQELKNGESLTFKFETRGEYAYFDKLGNFVGRVDVE